MPNFKRLMSALWGTNRSHSRLRGCRVPADNDHRLGIDFEKGTSGKSLLMDARSTWSPTNTLNRRSYERKRIMMMNRRVFSMALLAGAAAAVAPTALAHAPEAGKRAQPGFYRFKLGTIEITVVSDGTLAFPTETPFGRSGRGRKRPAHIHVPHVSAGSGANQHHPRQHWRQADVDRRRLRRRQIPEYDRQVAWQPRRRGLRAGRYRHDPVHSLPFRPPVGHQRWQERVAAVPVGRIRRERG